MHWGKISVISVIAGMMAYSASAEEGVVVDLGVLNNLNAGNYDVQEPMFPILPKQPIRQVKKKNVVKTTKPLPVAKSEKSTAPVIAKKSDTIKEATRPEVVVAKSEKDDFVVVVDREPVAESIAKDIPQTVEQQPSAPFDAKPMENPAIAEVPSANKVANAPEIKEPEIKNEIAKVTDTPEIKESEIKNKTIAKVTDTPEIKEPEKEVMAENKEEPALPSGGESGDETNVSEEKVELDRSTTENSVLPAENNNVVTEKNDDSAVLNGIIKFENDNDILNEEQQELIDKIVSGFSNDKAAKVAIYAYNFDDGVDGFRKKRITLNRAIEVRSYLLKKGFKNFNIKVVNISGNSKKINCVELKEI